MALETGYSKYLHNKDITSTWQQYVYVKHLR